MGSQGAVAFGPRGSSPLRRLQCVHTHCSMRAVAHTHGGSRGRTEAESNPRAILGQTQNWSHWRFCLCNICTRPFGANNQGLQARAPSASRGVASSFLLLLARLPCCCSSSQGAVCCLVASSLSRVWMVKAGSSHKARRDGISCIMLQRVGF